MSDTLQPFPGDRGARAAARARHDLTGPDLSATAFRCGSWSVRGPNSWRSWGLAEKASAVAGVALLAGVGLAALVVPVALVAALLRGLGVLS